MSICPVILIKKACMCIKTEQNNICDTFWNGES